MNWLVDTCVLSEYVKRQPTPEVIAWLDAQDERRLFISVITLGEIEKGMIKLRRTDPNRAHQLAAWLDKVEQRFAGRILLLDVPILRAWADLSGNAELAGRKTPVLDALLMATARCHGLTIVTRNTQDFSLFPHLYNPWPFVDTVIAVKPHEELD